MKQWVAGGVVTVALYAGAAIAQDAPQDEPGVGEPIVAEPMAGEPLVDPMPQARGVKWYDGFAITPGIGLRHFALHVEQGGNEGSLSNSIQNSFFAALDVQSPSLQFSENWGASVYLYSSSLDLSEQFTDNDDDGDDNSGETIDVGTSAKGRYSYVVPALHYDMPAGDGGHFRVALGFGKWFSTIKGDIILTPDNQPAAGMPKTAFDVKVDKNAYLFHMQWRTQGSWHFGMSVGGPKWADSGSDYKVEEVALVVGYALTPQTFGAP
jgi:hypothetical protein